MSHAEGTQQTPLQTDRCHKLQAVCQTSCRQAQHRSQVHLAAASADHDALAWAVRIQQDMVGRRLEHGSALLNGVQQGLHPTRQGCLDEPAPSLVHCAPEVLQAPARHLQGALAGFCVEILTWNGCSISLLPVQDDSAACQHVGALARRLHRGHAQHHCELYCDAKAAITCVHWALALVIFCSRLSCCTFVRKSGM